jgi:two-component system, OmpR family, response regulator
MPSGRSVRSNRLAIKLIFNYIIKNYVEKYSMKALIIDDEVDICNLLSYLLVKKNMQADYVNTLSQAMQVLEKDEPVIIFLDNHLPDGRGLDFVPYIKEKLPEVKLVMITAYDSPTDRTRALQKGVDDFVPKPFTREKIYRAVDQLVS